MLLKRCLSFASFTIVVAVFLVQMIPEGCSRSIEESNSYGPADGSTNSPESTIASDDPDDEDACGSFIEEDDIGGNLGSATGGTTDESIGTAVTEGNSNSGNENEDGTSETTRGRGFWGITSGITGGSQTGTDNDEVNGDSGTFGRRAASASAGDEDSSTISGGKFGTGSASTDGSGGGFWDILSGIAGGSQTGTDTDEVNGDSGTFGRRAAGASAGDENSSTISGGKFGTGSASTDGSGGGFWDILSGIAGGSKTGTDTDEDNGDSGIGVIGSILGSIFGRGAAGASAGDDKSSTISASGNITSAIQNIIGSYSGLTNEDSRNIIQSLQNFLSGSTHDGGGVNGDEEVPKVGSVIDLITVLHKYDLSTFLRVLSQYLVGWHVTINNTKYGILNLITIPQKQLYKLIQYVIFQNQHLIESVIRSIFGDNFLIDSIFKVGNKTVKCFVDSAEDLPAVIGDNLIGCVTGRVNEIIQLVADAVLEIRRGLELSRNMVNSVTGCDGLFCLGSAAGSTVTRGVGLMIDVIGTVAHSTIFAGTLFAQLPGCFVGSVTVTPGIEIAKMVGHMGRCMIS